MPAKKKTSGPTPVNSLRHQDQRTNIPTDELRDFAADDEANPSTLLYERDTSLDPQLVWKGKDEQDRHGLEVPAVPIYIQEKIEPQAIIENLRDTAGPGEAEPELTLFDDFDGLDFEQMVDFYHWPANWSNRLILGDSLLVMGSLAEKEGLKGQVQMIYLDPPYGIRFGSNWQVSTRKPDVKDGKADDLTRQPEQIRAFRDTWELRIHSYLAYLRDRLVVSRDLLTETGSVFVQIGDENQHLVRNVLDEVFGSENFVSLITFKRKSGAGSPSGGTEVLSAISDYILWYAKDKSHAKYRQVHRAKELGGLGGGQYNWIEEKDGTRRKLRPGEVPAADARVFRPDTFTSRGSAGPQLFSVEVDGKTYSPTTMGWNTNEEGAARLVAARRLIGVGKTLQYVRYFDDFPLFPISNLWEDTMVSGFAEPKVYVVQTNTKIVERCMHMCTDPGDLVLDPTCGSGTTAYVAEQWGRRWITIDTSRVAIALARTRLMSARFSYYLLADSADGRTKESELTGLPKPTTTPGGDVRQGFVCRRVPRITLRSIAQNPEIKQGMDRDEIDRIIARHADTEVLVDQPYEDGRRVRVTGRFTVESLSPHRVLDASEEAPASELDEGHQFVPMILGNLRKAGVQNTVKDERIKFDLLEPFAGEWLNAAGEYLDKAGNAQRVAISIGPEHGTVGPLQVKEAAKEALRGAGFDLLIVCGFAFDARAGESAKEFAGGGAIVEETRQLGRLPVMLARMNPDLAMGDELLKKTGAGNLFMVFGEPDLTIKEEDGQITVDLRGVDVYDPTTGQVRSNSTDDVACWFVDTNYNGESFFVRHAYFTGADEPYDRLSRALKADIDPDAWASLYRTTSRPFAPPETGRIAVKVINHYGDEVMQVYEVG